MDAKEALLEVGKMEALTKLEVAAGRSSWENMVESHPDIAAAIDAAVDAGASADDVYRTLRTNHDVEFCKWCRTVARFLEIK